MIQEDKHKTSQILRVQTILSFIQSIIRYQIDERIMIGMIHTQKLR